MRGREIETVVCSCGGTATEQEVTDEEQKKYGCGRRRGCCVAAFACDRCKTRWTFALAAPEYRD